MRSESEPHIPDLFDATDAEEIALLVREAKRLLDGRIHPDGHERRADRRQKVFVMEKE
jgi:hypothetical protein